MTCFRKDHDLVDVNQQQININSPARYQVSGSMLAVNVHQQIPDNLISQVN